jgi:hypothetical protein
MPRRIVILGGPHTGKTTLSTKLGIDRVHHSEDIKHLGWSESSEAASKWFSDQGDWVAEGVQMARALRKWLIANPDTPLDIDIVKLSKPFDSLVQGQQSMARGIETVFTEIEPELIERGARIHRLSDPNSAIDLFGKGNMAEDTDAKSDKTSEEEGKNTDDSAKGKDTDASKSQDTDKKFTQDDLNALAAKVRKEEKDKAQAAKDKEEKERLEKQAKEQGEHQKLAEQYEGELKELKPQLEAATVEVEKYKASVAEIVKVELKALPEEVRDMSPAQYAEDKTMTNPLDVLAWLPKGKALADKMNGQTAVKGNKPSPRANGNGDGKADERAKAEARRAYRD